DEPFGLSMVEAMACGTPVVACGRGSVPEILRHGETGFIVKNVDEAVEATRRIDQIDRARARRHVEENFSRDRMVEKYITAYQEVLKVKGGARRKATA